MSSRSNLLVRAQWTMDLGERGAIDATRAVFPGPVVQLMVAGASLARLGVDYRFATRVLAERADTSPQPLGTSLGAKDEVVRLALVGGGDPTLTYEDLRDLAQQVKDNGIKIVQGPVIADDSLFDSSRQGDGWFWDQESSAQQAQVGALSVDGNVATLTIYPGGEGQPGTVDLGRSEGYLTVISHQPSPDRAADGQFQGPCRGGFLTRPREGQRPSPTLGLTDGPSDVRVERIRGTNQIHLAGAVSRITAVQVPVDDPALYAGFLFVRALREAGVEVRAGRLSAVRGDAGGDEVAVHTSAALGDILRTKRPGERHYLVYEHLLRMLGSVDGSQGCKATGLAALNDYLVPIIGDRYRLMDGAGLARYNLLSAEQVRRYLGYVTDHQPELVELLAESACGRLLAYNEGGGAGMIGYWGEDAFPVAAMAFGHVETVNEQDMIEIMQDRVHAPEVCREGKLPAGGIPDGDRDGRVLVEDLAELLAEARLHNGFAGLHIADVDTGEEIYGHHQDVAFTPASNTKLFTSAAGLHYLGAHYRYDTPLSYRGHWQADGTLIGDIVLRGTGDPAILPETIHSWAKQLVQLGLRYLDGRVVVDDSAFSEGPLGNGWLSNLEVYGYSPQISSLSYNENVLTLRIHPGRQAGGPTLVEVEPLAGYLTIDNRVGTGEPGSEVALEEKRLSYRDHVVLTGAVPFGSEPTEIKVTVEDPAVYLGKALMMALSQVGVRVRPGLPVEKGVALSDDGLLFVHRSPELSKIIRTLNKHSDNFLAEMLIRTIGLVVGGEGHARVGARLVHEFLQQAGIEDRPHLVDGSGLTRHNLITPRQITQLLRHMSSHPEFAAYYDSLPIAGVDGTLRNRMKATRAYDNVRAKTGTMSGVSGLSGYVKTQSGMMYCFSILMNGYADPGAFVGMQNRIAARLAEE